MPVRPAPAECVPRAAACQQLSDNTREISRLSTALGDVDSCAMRLRYGLCWTRAVCGSSAELEPVAEEAA